MRWSAKFTLALAAVAALSGCASTGSTGNSLPAAGFVGDGDQVSEN